MLFWLMLSLLVVLGGAAAAGSVYAVNEKRRRGLPGGETRALPAGSDRLVERSVAELRVGDVLTIDTRDFLCEGVVHYDEDGHRWVAGRLIDVEESCWMVVGMDRVGSSAVRVLEPDDTIDVGGYPPDALSAAGKRYQLERRGTATVKVTGDIGAVPGSKDMAPESVLRCRWWRYQAAGPDCLLVEQWGSDFRVLRGVSVPDHDIDLMQGS
jgi:hypothetical protein